MSSDAEKELKKIYADRLKDKRQSRTKRRQRIEAHPQALGRLLPAYFTQSPKTLAKIEENRALLAWEKYVGESAAAVSKAVRFRGGTLTVRVSSPLWMQQLLLLKERILKHYQKDFPGLQVRSIFFTQSA
jgi:predicted nucleic acid-binding Zn ribbon protein